jgi:signal recognition particle receptor subunit beta
LADCFPAVDYMERNGVPFIVGVNLFHGEQQHSLDDVREALAVPVDVPMITTDARDRARTKLALLELVQHALLKAGAV